MKKVIFIIAIVAIAVTGLLYDVSIKNDKISDINIENAEALAPPISTHEKEVYACSYSGNCELGGQSWDYDPLPRRDL